MLRSKLSGGNVYVAGQTTATIASLFVGGKGAVTGKVDEATNLVSKLGHAKTALVTKGNSLAKGVEGNIKNLVSLVKNTGNPRVAFAEAGEHGSIINRGSNLTADIPKKGVQQNFNKVTRELSVPEKSLDSATRFDEKSIVDYTENMNSNYTTSDVQNLTELTTHNSQSDTALLGYFEPNSINSYEQIAHENNFTYFDAGSKGWASMADVDERLAHTVNRQFLINQLSQGKDIVLTSDPYSVTKIFETTGRGRSYMEELTLLDSKGYEIQKFGNFWKAVKK